MADVNRNVIARFMEQHKEALIDESTNASLKEPEDGGTERPRAQVRENFVWFVQGHITLLRSGDKSELEAFVRYVTALRAKSQFPMSTMVRACFALRTAMRVVLRLEKTDAATALAMLDVIDEVILNTTVLISDTYTEAIHHSLLDRRAALEAELRVLTDDKIANLAAQRQMMNTLSSPLLELWHGIVVAPLIGEFDVVRATDMRERIVSHVAEIRASVVLVDVTGLVFTDAVLAEELGRLVVCVRLLGAEAVLVGVSPAIAIALSAPDVRTSDILSFATLRDGLSAALHSRGLRVAPMAPIASQDVPKSA